MGEVCGPLETNKRRQERSWSPQIAQSQGEGHTATPEGFWRVPSGSQPPLPLSSYCWTEVKDSPRDKQLDRGGWTH